MKRIIKKLENGEDPVQRKKIQKVTKKIVAKVKKLIPQLKDGSLSYKKAEEQCGIGRKTVKRIIEKLDQKKDPTKREWKKITPEMKEKINELRPDIKSGKLCYLEVAEQLQISEDVVKKIVKKLNENDAAEKKKEKAHKPSKNKNS